MASRTPKPTYNTDHIDCSWAAATRRRTSLFSVFHARVVRAAIKKFRAAMKSQTIDLHELQIDAQNHAHTTWQGTPALYLENGLATVPNIELDNSEIEVLIAAEGPAYPGIVFRQADNHNYELAYAVPHCSGLSDAIQYDPVFNGSNTWQLYYGDSYQGIADVPMNSWFTFKVAFLNRRSVISVGDQSPLVVEKLVHPFRAGQFGLWTFQPAYFSDLQIRSIDILDQPAGQPAHAPEGAVDAWHVKGCGVVHCEPNGVLNLNRLFPPSIEEVHLVRSFELSSACQVNFNLGYSDTLSFKLDGELIHEGENTFSGFADRAARGYAELSGELVSCELGAGVHRISADLSVSEGFGWGLVVTVHAPGLIWPSVE